MQLVDLVGEFGRAPPPWSEGRTIPWDDPAFSRRMLEQHQSQEHDRASRRQELIDRHVDFILRTALPVAHGRVLDLGCGPGFYLHRFAAIGHDCLGIDFAPAAIEYARSVAARRSLNGRFELGDIRQVEFGSGFDLEMLLFGELSLFPRGEAVELLRKCASALSPTGRIILEVHSLGAVRSRGEISPTWSAVESGIFSERPHLRLDESFWLADCRCAAGRHWLIDAATAEVNRYGWTMQGYTDDGYATLLADAGLRLTSTFPSLTGKEDQAGFPVLLAAAEP